MIRLYDSRTQALCEFTPLVRGMVGMYVCGPTVQSPPHIGHLRSALVYDLWRRWFSYRGYNVTFVRNVTDIDDKVLANSRDVEPWWALAYRVELEFSRAYATLGILSPSYEPRTSAHTQQIQQLIATLIEDRYAYVADDSSGDVYFSVKNWPAYGTLTNQRPEDMSASPDPVTRGKLDQRDFALWKGTKPDEPATASWTAPWGPGRPGWHIQCSAMTKHYLGVAFDIHGGGLDLRFPHHENELAQSTAAGYPFASYWVRNGLVNINGQKMSKSLGNSIDASTFFTLARPLAIRYYLASAHYRSTIDYHEGALVEAEAAILRIETFLKRAKRDVPATLFGASNIAVVPAEFAAALDDDLSVPEALAVLHERTRAGNAALEAENLALAATIHGEVTAMTQVLGIDPVSPGWASDATIADHTLVALINRMLADRAASRRVNDFAAADRIRDELLDAGIMIEDTHSGARWRIK